MCPIRRRVSNNTTCLCRDKALNIGNVYLIEDIVRIFNILYIFGYNEDIGFLSKSNVIQMR